MLVHRTSNLLAAAAILTSTAGFALSNEVASLPGSVYGIGVIGIGFIPRENLRRILWLTLSSISMVLSASAVPRMIRIALGQQQPNPVATAVVAILSILSLFHLTLIIRWTIAQRRSARS